MGSRDTKDLERRIQAIEERLPLIVQWREGKAVPTTTHKGLTFYRNTDNGNLQILVRLGNEVYTFETASMEGVYNLVDLMLSGTLTVAGLTTLNGNLDVNGSTTVEALTANGNVNLLGTLDVTGQTTVDDLDATTLDVTGVTTVDDLNVGGALDVTGNATVDGDILGARILLPYGRPGDITGTNLLRPAGNVPWTNYTNGYIPMRAGTITGLGAQHQVSSLSATSFDLTARIYVNNSIVWSVTLASGQSAADFVPVNTYETATRAAASAASRTFNAGEPIAIKIEFGGTYSAATVSRISALIEAVFDT